MLLRLEYERRMRGFTQRQLEAETGIPHNTISNLELYA